MDDFRALVATAITSNRATNREADLARRYIELQHLETSGPSSRAVDVRKLIRAHQNEIATLERLGEGLTHWL